jgi:ATP-dependent DNA helicase RecQ
MQTMTINDEYDEAAKIYLLAKKFGNTRFKDFQKESIDTVLNKKNCLIIQPTGKGKSLCYQFPAVYTGEKPLL